MACRGSVHYVQVGLGNEIAVRAFGCGARHPVPGSQEAAWPRRTERPRADLVAELARFLPGRARRYLLFPPTSMRWKDCRGNMTVRDIPIAGNDRKTSRTFNFDRFSRTLIAAVQMVGDALILTTLSYVSLLFVINEHHELEYIKYLPYFVSTVGATIIMIFGFARSGVYDVI